MKSTVAVTGARGHIGNVVCRYLLENEYKVKAMYHTYKDSLNGLDIELIQGSVLSIEDLHRLISGCEFVINCAAIISIHGDPTGIVFKTNTEGPLNVLKVSTQLLVKKIIHISSVHAVNEEPLDLPFDESRPYKTSTDYIYDYSKAVGEQKILSSQNINSPDVIILRPSAVVGPYDFKPSELGKALINFYNQKIPVLPEGGYDFVDVRDVASSIIESLIKGNHGDIFLISGKYYSMREVAAIIRNIIKRKTPDMVIPYKFLKLSLPLIKLASKITGTTPSFTLASINTLKFSHSNINHQKATEQLLHKPRELEESISDFYKWAIQNQILK